MRGLVQGILALQILQLVFLFVEPSQEIAGNIVVALFVIGNELVEIDS